MKARDWFRFGHTAIFGYTAVLPLIGAGTATGFVTGWQIGFLLATAVSFHLFAYLLNDIIDLPLDRSQPSRADYPLVRGRVTVRQVWFWVVAQLPMLLLLWWVLGRNGRSLFWLCWAVVGMIVYNLWGKRSPLPPLTDLVQGSSWAALLLFGAAVVGQPTGQTWVAAGFIIVYILLVNGINGSLRDLANDYDFGAQTTAIWLGARPLPDGRFFISKRLRIYALFWQLVLNALALILPVIDKFPLGPGEDPVVSNIVLQLLSIICFVYLLQVTRFKIPLAQMTPWLMAHNILMLLLLFTAVFSQVDSLSRWAMGLAFVLPLLTADLFAGQDWHSSGSLKQS